MPLELTPLDPSTLSAAVARAAGPSVPPAAKMMAAKGLAPMAPKEMLTALYQLSHDQDAKVAAAAEQTADKLPDNILAGALAEALDGRVLDFFFFRVADRPPLVEKILLNGATDDETFVTMAKKLGEASLEILAGNSLRLLRHPPIIEALYFNKAARMSTVDRVLELAVRNGLTLERVPHFKELAASILQSGAKGAEEQEQARTAEQEAMDAAFAQVMSEQYDQEQVDQLEFDEEEEKKEEGEGEEQNLNAQQMLALPIAAKIRMATLGNAFHRSILIRDTNKLVSMAAIRSPAIKEQEVQRYAAHRGLSEDVIRYIAERREWQKHYQVKLALANNPKCPLAHSMRLLSHLRPNDLRILSRSRNVPAPLVQAAKRAIRKRS